MSDQQPGRVITFYSFKGGTGRTMALANIATELAQRNGNRVLVIDWDLEAPGLHRYFRPYLNLSGSQDRDAQISDSPGLIELLEALRDTLAASTSMTRGDTAKSVFPQVPLNPYLLPTDLPYLSLLKAGRFDATYSSRINSFDWTSLFAAQPEFFGAFADYLASQFTHVLIDSRTGYTDISGICTALLPDTLVVVFTPNLQSLSGALDMVEKAVKYRVESDDLRPLRTFPLVSRVELSEYRLNEAWRFGEPAQDIPGYQTDFERMFKKLYGVESCDLTAYFDQARIPYVPYYAFGERIAVRSEESGTINLAQSFSQMTDVLLLASSALEYQRPGPTSEPEREIPRDTQWFDTQWRPLSDIRIEARASLSRVRPSISRNQLLNTLRGAVSGNKAFSGASAPSLNAPPQDAVNTTILTSRGTSAYWVLRINGDCLVVDPLHPQRVPSSSSVEELVSSIAEILFDYKRLYSSLGIMPRADLRIDIKLGLSILDSSPIVDGYYLGPQVLGRIDNDLVGLTKRFAAPLITAFEGTTLTDDTYQRIVDEFLASMS